MPTTLLGTFPALLPGTTSSVSRNGLKLTTGSILFKPGQDADAIALTSSFGQLYPDEPPSRTTDMGLLEMSFSTYADTGASTSSKGVLLVSLSKSGRSFSSVPVSGTDLTIQVLRSYTVFETWLVDTITFHKVIPATFSSAAISIPTATISQSKKRSRIEGLVGTLDNQGNSPAPTELNIQWTNEITNITRRNFGSLDEVDITVSAVAKLL